MAEQLGKLTGDERKAVGHGQVAKCKGERKAKTWVGVLVGTEDGGGGKVALRDTVVSVERGTWCMREPRRFLATTWARGSV